MKSFAFASLLAAGLAVGAAQAQAPLDGTGRLLGGGSVVGGGLGATMVGSGDDMSVVYSSPGAGGGAAGFAQAGLSARFSGAHGDGPQFDRTAPAASGLGREAWLSGGGDDAQVAYSRAR